MGGSEKEAGTEEASTDYLKLTDYFKLILGDLVKEVKISRKLTSSPACLAVGSGSMDIRMERFLIEQKQLAAASAKILELNPKHKIIEKINNDLNGKGQSLAEDEQLIKLIFDQACIIEGEPVPDAAAFSRRLDSFLAKAML